MLRVGLVGLGRIAQTFLSLRNEEDSAHWKVVGAIKRNIAADDKADFPIVDSLDSMGALEPDLLIDFSGPNALNSYGANLLRLADVWTVGAAALVSEMLESDLRDVARETGHRLRLLPGAIGGLDALSAMTIDPSSTVSIFAYTASKPVASGIVDNARSVVSSSRGVNVIAAAALASQGLDRTPVDHVAVGDGEQRRFVIEANGGFGALRVSIDPVVDAKCGTMLVAASAIVALRNSYRSIWVG
ncbi:DUF108 domain-containing protein [Bosea sp. F3-2]|nr:DUF108 domain-containing protein [Bosea sp. F3-2]